jgi:hypothetical protein
MHQSQNIKDLIRMDTKILVSLMLDFVRGSRNNSKSHITQCQIEAANNRPDNPMQLQHLHNPNSGFDEGSPLIVQPPQD